MAYLQRILEKFLAATLNTRPLVYLNGMRQCGKSTLVQNLSLQHELNYLSFDDPASLLFAGNDPSGFIEQLPQSKLNIIDEVQLAPELFRYFKMAVDKKRIGGKDRSLYLLTGSANIFALPRLADALVGRMSILTLYRYSPALPFDAKGHGRNFKKRYDNHGAYF